MIDDDNLLPNGNPSETEDIVGISMSGYSRGTWNDLQTLKAEHRRGNKQRVKIT